MNSCEAERAAGNATELAITLEGYHIEAQ